MPADLLRALFGNVTVPNVTFTEDVERDREKSLRLMRERMFSERARPPSSSAAWAGSFKNTSSGRVVSTGGAVLDVAARMGSLSADLTDERDYVALFHRHLGISVKEERYRDPTTQPAAIEERFWRPTAKR